MGAIRFIDHAFSKLPFKGEKDFDGRPSLSGNDGAS